MLVSGRNSARGMHSELKRNIDFCDTNFEISTPWTDTVLQTIGFVSNSFCDLTAPIESHGREKHTQNTIVANEFTDLEIFTHEHAARPKTMHVSISAKRPGTGITLQLTPHTTAVSHTSAGGVHWQGSSPSRPSTLINPKSKLPPSAPIHARTVLHIRVVKCRA